MPIVLELDQMQTRLNFPCPFVGRPRLAHGIRLLDLGKHANIRVSSLFQHLTETSADCYITTCNTTPNVHRGRHVRSFVRPSPSHLVIWSPSLVNARTVEIVITHNELGPFPYVKEPVNDENGPNSLCLMTISTVQPLDEPRRPCLYRGVLDLDKNHNWRVETTASDIDVMGFTPYRDLASTDWTIVYSQVVALHLRPFIHPSWYETGRSWKIAPSITPLARPPDGVGVVGALLWLAVDSCRRMRDGAGGSFKRGVWGWYWSDERCTTRCWKRCGSVLGWSLRMNELTYGSHCEQLTRTQ
ncbi:hypothetical protein EDB89DRAFT_2242857 [Lactarius sanguifluus]|nr:hypothetical protein EDB89DRAFT_2242857 [Lactarius sanguifluus]